MEMKCWNIKSIIKWDDVKKSFTHFSSIEHRTSSPQNIKVHIHFVIATVWNVHSFPLAFFHSSSQQPNTLKIYRVAFFHPFPFFYHLPGVPDHWAIHFAFSNWIFRIGNAPHKCSNINTPIAADWFDRKYFQPHCTIMMWISFKR